MRFMVNSLQDYNIIIINPFEAIDVSLSLEKVTLCTYFGAFYVQ